MATWHYIFLQSCTRMQFILLLFLFICLHFTLLYLFKISNCTAIQLNVTAIKFLRSKDAVTPFYGYFIPPESISIKC